MRKNEDDGKTEGEKRVIVFDTWQYRKSIIGDIFSILRIYAILILLS